MPNDTVSHSKYILTGSIMLIMCVFLMIIYVNHLKYQVDNSQNYKKDKCEIETVLQVRTKFDCWTSGSVSLVEIPCVIIFLNTSSSSNVVLYRNVMEKMFMISNNLNCSYAPSACQNDPDYLERFIRNNFLELFPPMGLKFDCFTRNQKYSSDALLYLPDEAAYHLSIAVISIGFAISAFLVLYGCVKMELETGRNYYGFFKNLKKGLLSELTNTADEEEFLKYVKKVLGEAHINVYDISSNTLDDDNLDLDDERISLDDNILRIRSNSMLRRSINSTCSINIKQSDNPKGASKLKLGTNEICIGRIEYRAPSSSRLSRQNSLRSVFSSASDSTDKSDKNINFYLGHGTESNTAVNKDDELDIPDAIMEEDERYLSIQKKPSDNKLLPVSKLFAVSSDDEDRK